MKQKVNFLLILIMAISVTALAQSEKNSNANSKKSAFGIEADVVPYVLGGAHGSVWYGYKNWRFRLVGVSFTSPDSFLDENFKDNKVKVFAFITDYFFKQNWKGLFLSTGLEYLDGKISHKLSSNTATYNNTLFTFGTGYVFKLYKNFYIAPHAAFTLRLSGDSEVKIDNYTNKIKSFMPEGGLRIGIHF